VEAASKEFLWAIHSKQFNFFEFINDTSNSVFTLDSLGQQFEMNAPAGEDGWIVAKQKHYLQVIILHHHSGM
jgi:hypothetical protein